MNTLPTTVAITAGLLVSSVLHATDAPHSVAAKRQAAVQIVACMKRRMSTDRHISYNEAGRACRGEVFKQMDGTETTPLVADVKH